MKRTALLIAALTFVACTDAAAPPVPVETDLASAKGGAGASGGGATVLPTFGGGGRANAINDAGIVVGVASEAPVSRYVGGRFYPAKWVRDPNDASWSVSPLGADSAEALALNEAGDAVGVGGGKARIWLATGHEDSLGAGGARGINDAGIIVGGSHYGCGSLSVCSAYAWVPSAEPNEWTRHTLLLLEEGGSAEAIAINEHSVITGAATRAGLSRAVIWLPVEGGWSAPIPREGTDASPGTSAGFAINDNGDVAGYSRACLPTVQCGGSRPYLWPAGGGSVNLASSISNVNAGLAYGISNEARVVGLLGVTRGNGGGPFSWNPITTTLTDLGDGEAKDINNGSVQYGREAVGSSSSSRGQRALVWRIP